LFKRSSAVTATLEKGNAHEKENVCCPARPVAVRAGLSVPFATFGLGYYWVSPQSFKESRPGEIGCDRKAAGVRRVSWTPADGQDLLAFGDSIAGGLAFWDTLS
jgi:hypothetical protein